MDFIPTKDLIWRLTSLEESPWGSMQSFNASPSIFEYETLMNFLDKLQVSNPDIVFLEEVKKMSNAYYHSLGAYYYIKFMSSKYISKGVKQKTRLNPNEPYLINQLYLKALHEYEISKSLYSLYQAGLEVDKRDEAVDALMQLGE